MGVLKVQLTKLSVALPYNRENHELLAPICKKLAEDFPCLAAVYLHHNSIYLKTNVYRDHEMASMYLTLGVELQKAFKKPVGATITFVGNYDSMWDQVHIFEREAAGMLYEEYEELLRTDSTADLFGIESATPFEKMPVFFKVGEDFKGTELPPNAIPFNIGTTTTASGNQAFVDIISQFNAIFGQPQKP